MSIEIAREYLKKWNLDSRIQEFEVSSATVELAAENPLLSKRRRLHPGGHRRGRQD